MFQPCDIQNEHKARALGPPMQSELEMSKQLQSTSSSQDVDPKLGSDRTASIPASRLRRAQTAKRIQFPALNCRAGEKRVEIDLPCDVAFSSSNLSR